MPACRVLVVAAILATVALVLPSLAVAGTVTRTSDAITYEASPGSASNENVAIGFESGTAFVTSELGTSSSSCDTVDSNRVDCSPAPAFVVKFRGFDDTLTTDQVGAAATVEAHGGGGIDHLDGGLAGDKLFGDEQGDVLRAKDGEDTVVGGSGSDVIDAGDGADTVGSRDAAADSVNCGPGFDTVVADANDNLTGCERADVDGDGSFSPYDCGPRNPAVHPGAREIRGNSVDENCDGVKEPFPTIASGIIGRFALHERTTRVTKLHVTKLPAGARVRVTCADDCPFAAKTRSFANPQDVTKFEGAFEGKRLPAGTIITVRVTAPRRVGKVVRFTTHADKPPTRLARCLPPGASKPRAC